MSDKSPTQRHIKPQNTTASGSRDGFTFPRQRKQLEDHLHLSVDCPCSAPRRWLAALVTLTRGTGLLQTCGTLLKDRHLHLFHGTYTGTVHVPSTVLDARDTSTPPISPKKTTLSWTLNTSWVSEKLLDELVRSELMKKGKKRGLNTKQNKKAIPPGQKERALDQLTLWF